MINNSNDNNNDDNDSNNLEDLSSSWKTFLSSLSLSTWSLMLVFTVSSLVQECSQFKSPITQNKVLHNNWKYAIIGFLYILHTQCLNFDGCLNHFLEN